MSRMESSGRIVAAACRWLPLVALVLVVAQPGLTLAQDGSWLPGISNVTSSLSQGDQLRDGNDNWWGGFGDPSSSPGTNGTVYAVASYQGRLVVGGGFSTAGGIYVSNIAMWDGAAWVGLGNGSQLHGVRARGLRRSFDRRRGLHTIRDHHGKPDRAVGRCHMVTSGGRDGWIGPVTVPLRRRACRRR